MKRTDKAQIKFIDGEPYHRHELNGMVVFRAPDGGISGSAPTDWIFDEAESDAHIEHYVYWVPVS
jgi:hypothetical protein